MSAGSLLHLDGIGKQFRQGAGLLRAVEDVSLSVYPGETLGVVGESGCGKSTLGRLALRLMEPSAGRVFFDGNEITGLSGAALRRLRGQMQIVFQDPNASLNPRWRVGRIVAEPLAAQGWPRARQQMRVAEVLALVGLPADAADRLPGAFSGGQRQRIGIARALAPAPRFILCDEAVSALDASVQAQILNLLADLQRRLGLTLLFISHNLAVIRHVSHRVAVLYLGRIVELAPEAVLFDRPLHPYTAALIAAVPEPGHRPQSLLREAEPPDALAPPPGCPFHPRCPAARSACAEHLPDLAEAAPGHWVRCHFPGEIRP